MGIRLCKLDFVAFAALACYGASVLPFIPREISSVAGVTLCFILTGFAVASAILPGRVSAAARFSGIIACSLATGIVGGLILNIFPAGLVQVNWATYALATTLIAYAVARARGATDPLQCKRQGSPILTWSSGAKFVCAALLVAAAVVVSIGSKQDEKPFTEVWLVPDAPAQSPVGAKDAVFGIKSHEQSDEEFTVVIDNGAHTTTSRVRLAPKEVWTQAFPVEGDTARASVYRGGPDSPVYRTVWFVTH